MSKEILSHAADPIAAHFGFAAVGIEYTHLEISHR